MSICVDIITKKEISPMDVAKHLADQGEQILLLNDEFPHLWFAAINKSTRGIEVNKEEYGYEIRMCAFSSKYDYLLSLKTIKYIQQKTNGKIKIDDEEITNLDDYFTDTAINEHFESEQNCITALMNHEKKISIGGIFCSITLGENYFKRIGISDKDTTLDAHEKLMNDILRIQWCHAHKKSTSTRLQIAKPDDNDDRVTVSALFFDENGSDCNFINEAPLFCIYNNKDDNGCLINYKYLKEIAPSSWSLFDECQYDIEPMSYDECVALMQKAKKYENINLFTDIQQHRNTVILKWNPSFSSYRVENYMLDLRGIIEGDDCYFNWSVWDYPKIHKGDCVYWVKSGYGQVGIVAKGTITSDPYKDEDWSGQGRETYYVDFIPEVMINPDTLPILTSEELSKEIPDFDWFKGHSGLVLSESQAEKLEHIWEKFIEKNHELFDKVQLKDNNDQLFCKKKYNK